MNTTHLLRLYGEPRLDAVIERVASGCCTVLKGSTWGQFAKTGPGFTARDTADMAQAMATYILAPLDGLSGISIELSGNCYMVGNRFDPHCFAEGFSEDLLAESTHPDSTAPADPLQLGAHDRATAAVLFRYKYCFLAEEFFGVGAIRQWAELVRRGGGCGASAEAVLHLIDALVSITLVDPMPFPQDLLLR